MWGRGAGRGACSVDVFDDGVAVEVDGDEFAIGFLEFQAVEPEFVVFGVGEPGAGLLLAHALDDAFDGDGERVLLAWHLLCDADALAWGEFLEDGGHGGW